MKKIFSVLMVALLAMSTVACNKDDDKKDNSNQGSNTSDIAANTLIYDGAKYTGEAAATIFPNGEDGYIQYVFGHMEEDMSVSFQVMGGLYSDAYNRTFDLTKHIEDLSFNFHINVGEGVLDVQYQNFPQNFWGFLDGDNLGAESAFTSGTAKITLEDMKLTVEVDGTLKNGKSLKFKFVTECHEG